VWYRKGKQISSSSSSVVVVVVVVVCGSGMLLRIIYIYIYWVRKQGRVRARKVAKTSQALRSGAAQALDSLVNLPPDGGSRHIVFTRPSFLKLMAVTFGAKHLDKAIPKPSMAVGALCACCNIFVCTIGSSEFFFGNSIV
jgi:hypothetical protein